MNAPTGLPWIRSPRVVELLEASPIAEKESYSERLSIPLAAEVIRAQARSAHFHFQDGSRRVLYNWPIPGWVWQLASATFRLREDRFYAVIDEFEPPAKLAEQDWSGLWKIELLELKFHEKELIRHFAIPAQAAIGRLGSPAQANPKTAPKAQLKRWLEDAFAKDPSVQKTRAELCEEAIAHFDAKLSAYRFGQVWSEVTADHPSRTAKGRRPQGTKPK